jgi:hypothetical protein
VIALRRAGPWAVLGLLLIWSGWQAVTHDRSDWPFHIGDEGTYAMAAASLAWDFDFRFEEPDVQRFRELWGGTPDLILQSSNGGDTITFGKPLFYPLYLAPFLRAAPRRGPAIANFLLLAGASLFAAWVLSSSLPTIAPLLVSLFVYCSLTFAHVFWIHPDLFFLTVCTLALGIALSAAQRTRDASLYPTWAVRLRPWILVGALVAILGSGRPPYFVVLLPIVFLIPKTDRRSFALVLVLTTIVCTGLCAAAQLSFSETFTAYGAERRGFTGYTGYPGIDFPASEWNEHIERYGNVSWIREGALEPELDARLLGWNSFYLFLGRNVGVVPYFLPLLLPLLLGSGRLTTRRSWPSLLAFAIAMTAFFLLRPFNFYGGAGSLANRYFLPLYPLFWFLPIRTPSLPLLGATALLAAVFVAPLWWNANGYPIAHSDDPTRAAYRYISGPLYRWLPHETSQRHIRARGSNDIVHHGLWTRFLTGGASRGASDEEILIDDRGGELLVGTGRALAGLTLRTSRSSSTVLAWHQFRKVELEPGERQPLDLGFPSALHPMWWPGGPIYLYRLKLQPSDGDVSLRIKPIF